MSPQTMNILNESSRHERTDGDTRTYKSLGEIGALQIKDKMMVMSKNQLSNCNRTVWSVTTIPHNFQIRAIASFSHQ